MPYPIPITPELWARCKRLDPVCGFYMSRIGRRVASGAETRVWLVRIAPHGRFGECVASENLWLHDALLGAVTLAEDRGWHTPEAREWFKEREEGLP